MYKTCFYALVALLVYIFNTAVGGGGGNVSQTTFLQNGGVLKFSVRIGSSLYSQFANVNSLFPNEKPFILRMMFLESISESFGRKFSWTTTRH